MAYLILIRHGYSEYNIRGLWTGWRDPDLTLQGRKEAKKAALAIKEIPFSIGYTSPQIRHKETLEIVKNVLGLKRLPTISANALKERNYGKYTGRNKWEVEKELGKENFTKLRRGWDYPVPNGESLKQVYERVVSYYKTAILPNLLDNKNVIISSSGNALRSLVKYIENISNQNIVNLEISPGEVYVYLLDPKGKMISREIRNAHPNTV